MVDRLKVLALVPARGGSKSIPRKNLRRLAGHPLVAYSIAAARQAGSVSRVIVSTDDAEIAAVAREYGAETPFLRPAELSEDDTPDLPVFQHALRWLREKEGYQPEIIVHLRPTSPLRKVEQIEHGIRLLEANPAADSVRSVAAPIQNPYKMWSTSANGFLQPLLSTEVEESYNLPRQKLPPVHWQTGYVDATRWRTVMELNSMTGRNILPLESESLDWVDIDTESSLEFAEHLIARGQVAVPLPHAGSAPRKRRPWPEKVRLLVLDFDGVFTDNYVWVDQDGKEAARFSRGDGLGITRVRQAGIEVLVLSAEQNPIVAARCRKLGITCVQGISDKRSALLHWARERSLDLQQAVYVGNDVNDLACMEVAGAGVTVPDAHPEVLEKADWVLSRPGGRGAVREVCDRLLENKS